MLASEVINVYEAFLPSGIFHGGRQSWSANWHFGQGYPKGHGGSRYSVKKRWLKPLKRVWT